MNDLADGLSYHELGFVTFLAPGVAAAKLQEVFDIEERHEFFEVNRGVLQGSAIASASVLNVLLNVPMELRLSSVGELNATTDLGEKIKGERQPSGPRESRAKHKDPEAGVQ